jgi:hypothetical protein
VDVMRGTRTQASVQAMACLSLMGLVRGEGELCQANQWAIAKVRDANTLVPSNLASM